MIAKAGRPIAELHPISRPDLHFGTLAGELLVDDEVFAGADQDIASMWDADLQVEQ